MNEKRDDTGMRALLGEGIGGLKVSRATRPRPREGEALLRVAAAGINRADLAQLAGAYPPPPGASEILGLEAAGEVVELGPSTAESSHGVTVGSKAYALLTGGGYAEFVTVPHSLLTPVPDGWSLAEAAAFAETAYTAYLNLFMEAELKAGERVLIHGGASGVGTAAIAQAKLAGATVIATAGGPEKVAVAERQGADLAIDRFERSFGEVVAREVGEVEVILDMVGESYFEANLSLLATGGRLVSIATLSGRWAKLDLGLLMRKRARLIGSTLRSRPLREKVAIREGLKRRFGEGAQLERLRPLIDAVYPWERVNEAHARMRANETIGKLVLDVAGSA